MDYLALGRRVRKQRNMVFLTQEQLANEAGISASFLGHIERGSRKASVETLVNIANTLKIGVDVLLTDSLKYQPKDYISDTTNIPPEIRDTFNMLINNYMEQNGNFPHL